MRRAARVVCTCVLLWALAGCSESSLIPCVRPAPYVLSPSTVEIGVGMEVTLERQPNAGTETCPPRPDGNALVWRVDVPGIVSLVVTDDSSATLRGQAPGSVTVTAALADDLETKAIAKVFVE